MRRFFLSATLFLLIAGLLMLWSHRFEQVPGVSMRTLADLRAAVPVLPAGAAWTGIGEDTGLLLTVGPECPRVSLQMAVPGMSSVGALHIKSRMVARNLSPGGEVWEDGRVLIEWRSSDGNAKRENDPVSSLRDDEIHEDISVVVRPSAGSALPVLRVEHLGRRGELEISKFEMVPVRERELWKSCRWAMLAAWFFWIWLFLAGPGNRSIGRRALAAGIWIGVGVNFAVPGPWKTLRPLVIPFETRPPTSRLEAVTDHAREVKMIPDPSSLPPPDAEVIGQLPLQGGWIIQVKHYLANLRPLLHAMLLFGPTLAFAWLVGRRHAMLLSAALAVSIEAAQTGFGYGFDWIDVFDLASDAMGIAMGIWAWGRIKKRNLPTCASHKKSGQFCPP